MHKFKPITIHSIRGFTLIELLVVIAIVAVLASIVLSSLNSARTKGNDSAVKANLAGARSQSELYALANTYSYLGVCGTAAVGGIKPMGDQILAAAKVTGLTAYSTNGAPTAPGTTVASCNESAGAWAAEAPLKTSGQMWCIDSTGKSNQTTGTSFTTPTPATDYLCQ